MIIGLAILTEVMSRGNENIIRIVIINEDLRTPPHVVK